ncbi:Druantia anti-phage system protein DruA [candidate division CSSED10-310 bacterium]|uniref:Druantia anti-phage system protein DruA n=1 Tax=candidate division CSSED10-310 bacterium TaxID=2855610 RepID=A0ABV6YQV1_UNCC1
MSIKRYSGRIFTEAEVTWIKSQIQSDARLSRSQLSRRFCKTFQWRKPNGTVKDVSCRVAFLHLERDGLIKLPPQKQASARAPKHIEHTLLTAPGVPLDCCAGELGLECELVIRQSSRLWNEFIDRYHYLGYKTLPGAQIRYFILSQGDVIALLGFGAAAWKTAPRDDFIGWSPKTRRKNLHLVINNARFLILPWIRVKNLGSRILSLVSKRIADDWMQVYQYRPVLLESFVQKDRFSGTVYKASNWLYVGDTTGRGKLARTHKGMKKQKKDKCFEPDWSLGTAITYMQNHWTELTAFLRIEGAPLDNNCVERALKKVQLHRKNAYFFKTEFGAQVADMFMGLIETCVLAETNPFDYLVTLIEKASDVKAAPEKWLPWNYCAA